MGGRVVSIHRNIVARLRGELLNRGLFMSLPEARVVLDQ